MLLKTTIIHETHVATVSILEIDGVFFGFILEDGFRENKVPGETRIPGGRYRILPRTEGKFYTKYKSRFKHRFVPHLQDVPGFTFILMHIGNGPDDSRGCLLVGRQWIYTGNSHCIGNSSEAYQRLYETIEGALLRKEEVWIVVDRTPMKDRISVGQPAPAAHTAATIL
ncbi:MAG: DUF5675 family protein [Bacteroidetes bacterium]|nr:DUF5675 family protein [Bacteroidota bacterium]